MLGQNPLGGLSPNCLEEDIRDVITRFKFGVDRFRGLASAEGLILPFLIDVDGRPYNTLTLPCDRVIVIHYLYLYCLIVCSLQYFAVRNFARGQ